METSPSGLLATPAPRNAIDSVPLGGTPLLVIDDHAQTLELMRRSLTREGFSVFTATRGAEGLELARRVRPAAILLDVEMPEMDGWGVLSALKADPQLASIPVVMLTMVDEKTRGFALGAADYLLKPVDRVALAARLRRLAELKPAAPPATPMPAVTPAPTASAAHRALVVEDDAANRKLLARLVRKEGWLPVEAENGRDALAKLAEGTPDLILLDLTMPVMSGFAFLHEIRRNPALRSVPVLVLSARDLSDAERTDLSGNVQAILQKGSCSVDQLQTAIRARARKVLV